MKKKITKAIQSMLDKYYKGMKLVLLTNVGDRAYGISTNNTYYDIRGVFFYSNDILFQMYPKENIATGFLTIEDEENNGDINIDFHLESLPSFIQNLTNNDLQTLETLCVDKKDILYANSFAEILFKNTSIFLTKNLYYKALMMHEDWGIMMEDGIIGEPKEKICKNMMYFIHAYLTVIDALNEEEMHTYKFKNTPFLRAIQNGKYIQSDGSIKNDFHDLIDDLKHRLDDAYTNTRLPENVSCDALNILQKQMIQSFAENQVKEN